MNCINYHFTCMPNGYSPVTKMFKKLTKAPFAHLQTMGHNDSYLQGDTYKSCLDNTMTTIQALRALGSLYIQRSQLSYQRKKLYPQEVIPKKFVFLKKRRQKQNGRLANFIMHTSTVISNPAIRIDTDLRLARWGIADTLYAH